MWEENYIRVDQDRCESMYWLMVLSNWGKRPGGMRQETGAFGRSV